MKDLDTAKKVDCIYKSLCLIGKNYGKKYKFNGFLNCIGNFKNSEHRRFFLYSFFDSCAYSRQCPRCNCSVSDILHHILTDCTKGSKIRLKLILKLLLLKATRLVPSSKLTCKRTLYFLAMSDRLYMETVCEFLVDIGFYVNPNLNS